MKIASLALAAVGTFALITATSVSASDLFAAPTHADLAHRNADRQQTLETARSIGLSHSQMDRLTSTLQHQQRDDEQAHRSSSRGVQSYRYSASNGYYGRATHGVRTNRFPSQQHSSQQHPSQQYSSQQYSSQSGHGYSDRRFQTASPSHSNSIYRYARPAYNTHGLNISTPRFSLRLGH